MDNGAASKSLNRPEPECHEPGCPNAGPPYADALITHIDVFCDCHRWTEPRILQNGTDVAWPAGWSIDQAKEWRITHALTLPEVLKTGGREQ